MAKHHKNMVVTTSGDRLRDTRTRVPRSFHYYGAVPHVNPMDILQSKKIHLLSTVTNIKYYIAL